MIVFENRPLVIGTMHGKEQVIAPVLESSIGVICHVPAVFNTDLLGTFSGEIERVLDPVETVRKKCLMAMDFLGCDLGIASEGSFGPHPGIPFLHANDEWLIFIDQKHGIEILVRELSLETNFQGREVSAGDELEGFLASVKFPQHSVMIRTLKQPNHWIKGIGSRESLEMAIQDLQIGDSRFWIETDMRAMHNPTRMGVIEKAAQKLVTAILSTCPSCSMPGFVVSSDTRGLPCELCGLPTNAVLSHLYTCKHCSFEQELNFPLGKQKEDPMYCQRCNP
ncbi:MAG: hypothetical protein RI983_2197 [Bacteroidota bacterium]|jgi:hypothetical protein